MARELGMTLAELHARMGTRELAQWQALYTIEPWGEEREDWRAASICYWLYRLYMQQLQKRPDKQVKDFLLQFGALEEQSPEQLKQKILAINAMFGGRVKKRKASSVHNHRKPDAAGRSRR